MLTVSIWMCIARHAQSIQNDNFALSFQYLMETWKDEVDFLHVGKHQRFHQIDIIILGVCGQAYPNYPK